eukprot:m.134033 g.134033  ORF g.134033 m.134033 type:complete len:66 (+) comp9497_c0_seq2:261-458(+)
MNVAYSIPSSPPLFLSFNPFSYQPAKSHSNLKLTHSQNQRQVANKQFISIYSSFIVLENKQTNIT